MSGYSIDAYGTMIADKVRMAAYVQALRQSIKPHSVVLDLGTGTGIFALLACKFGARKVYAIESSDAIEVAREIASANGHAERIELIQDKSTRVTLPERADVIISDLHGVLPYFQHHIPTIVDARQRFLAPGGTLIPQRETVWTAVVEAPELYKRYTTPWNDNEYELDMEAARRIVVNNWQKTHLAPEQILIGPKIWATIDYTTVTESNISGAINGAALGAGIAHGLIVWFDTVLAEGAQFSNAPGKPELIYGGAFFPWFQPVILAADDSVSIALRADLVGEDYIWSWDTTVKSQGDPMQTKADFKQSTFHGVPLSPSQLRKQAASFVPALDESGQIDRIILEMMDGRTSLGDIARLVAERYSSHFPTWDNALNRVCELSKRYGR